MQTRQPKMLRVKALKMFTASIDGASPIMLHPGDVVDVDLFQAGMLMRSEKCELTEEKPRINKEYVAPAKVDQTSDTGAGAFMKALTTLNSSVQALAQKSR